MSFDPMANGRLNRWRHKGDGPATYTAGSKQFADDVIVLLDDVERLRAAVERMGIGVNHIATYRTDKWPDYGTACDAALETLGAGQEYDMWCCWNAAMCARDELAGTHEQRANNENDWRRHDYVPSAMHMGDCAKCGHPLGADVHKQRGTADGGK